MQTTAGPEPVRLFLVGLSEGFARSLARYLANDPRVALAGVAPSLALAGLLLTKVEPDLALLDLTAIDGSSVAEVRALRERRPGLRIVCVASEADPYRAAAAAAGVDALISRDGFAGDFDRLLGSLFPAHRGAPGGRND